MTYPDLIICSFILSSVFLFQIIINYLRLTLGGWDTQMTLWQIIDSHSKEYGWMLRLFINCLGYSCIFLPGFLIYKYINKTNYLEKSGISTIHKFVSICFGYTESHSIENQSKCGLKRSASREACLLIYCFCGLMVSYLIWGILQEKIITQEYTNQEGKKTYFKESQFLVFVNRLLAFIIAISYISLCNHRHAIRKSGPIYKYSFASFSNIMSAWFQYEALKFVNFPTQVLAKSCKIIPVMLMGKVISKNKYEFYEYVTAVLISFGMILFLLGSNDDNRTSSITTITGLLLLSLYMLFDSFTSNWQGQLFKTYGMTPIQMMCGVNLFSSCFTATSLGMQGGFLASIEFAIEHPKFIIDCMVLSISSTIGQLFIFYTIATFGPVVFTIIMTVRQAVAILLSCLIYNHVISSYGIIGIIIVFIAIFLRVYCNQRLKTLRREAEIRKTKIPV